MAPTLAALKSTPALPLEEKMMRVDQVRAARTEAADQLLVEDTAAVVMSMGLALRSPDQPRGL